MDGFEHEKALELLLLRQSAYFRRQHFHESPKVLDSRHTRHVSGPVLARLLGECTASHAAGVRTSARCDCVSCLYVSYLQVFYM